MHEATVARVVVAVASTDKSPGHAADAAVATRTAAGPLASASEDCDCGSEGSCGGEVLPWGAEPAEALEAAARAVASEAEEVGAGAAPAALKTSDAAQAQGDDADDDPEYSVEWALISSNASGRLPGSG